MNHIGLVPFAKPVVLAKATTQAITMQYKRCHNGKHKRGTQNKGLGRLPGGIGTTDTQKMKGNWPGGTAYAKAYMQKNVKETHYG